MDQIMSARLAGPAQEDPNVANNQPINKSRCISKRQFPHKAICIACSSLFIILITILIKQPTQTSCQTVTSTATTNGAAAAAAELSAKCNHNHDHHNHHRAEQQNLATKYQRSRNQHQHQQQQQQQQQQLVKQHRMLENYEHLEQLSHHNHQQQQQQQHRLSVNARQQRQFNQHHQQQVRSAAMTMAEPPGQPQPEEFSLGTVSPNAPPAAAATGLQASDPTMMSSSSVGNLVVATAPGDGGQNLTNSGYSLLANPDQAQPTTSESAPVPTTTTTTTTTSTSASSPPVSRGDLQASIPTSGSMAPPPTTSSSERVAPPATTPVVGPESLNAPQPPATTSTTSSSLASAPVKPQQQQMAPTTTTTRQQGRRYEETSTSSLAERHASNLALDNGDSPPHDTTSIGSKHSISSAPSSVSIITPLMGPPNQAQAGATQATIQQQQQQTGSSSSSSSSMMKPIYVVGNPIGEMDYTSTTYEQQQQQRAKSANSGNGAAAAAAPANVRAEKRVEIPLAMDQIHHQLGQALGQAGEPMAQQASVMNATLFNGDSAGERMNGPALVYSEGRLVGVPGHDSSPGSQTNTSQQQQQQQQLALSSPADANQPQPQSTSGAGQAHAPRLLQSGGGGGGALSSSSSSPNSIGGAAVLNNNPRRPSLPPPVNQEKAASGFRSPLSPSGPLIGQPVAGAAVGVSSMNSLSQPPLSNSIIQQPVNSQPMMVQAQLPNFYQTSPPYGGGAAQLFAANMANQQQQQQVMTNKQAFALGGGQQQQQQMMMPSQFQLMQQPALPPQASITNQQQQGQIILGGGGGNQNSNGTAATGYQSRRPLNITRVEHISAECSNDLIRAVILFNGTFKGIIYSSGYVNDPTCLYVNGSGLTRYEFSIRLNQCGTLGRQEMHQPAIPGEARRRDQVMWNTLSIQYNPVIEQEWDEHFRVSCEYGSDFWKTISFSPFNVETNTGSPVVFTINPPQCQMDVLLGHGMGPKIAVDGPVTVGDPLTLLIHMKSEKAGYDILVKNCVAHNGGKQRMQLIDNNGCVVNERFISPFRGTYNDNDLRHVTLYAYLKAFRFTGSPVLYLECEIHMCQSACPPQMCYWRRLSKRSVDNNDFEYTDERNSTLANGTEPVISDSLSLFKALQVRHEPTEPARARQRAQTLQEIYAEDEEAQLVCYRHAEVLVFMITLGSLFLLVLTVAITCCLRVRNLTRGLSKHANGSNGAGLQFGGFQHSRLAGSLSPSLSSINEALSSLGTGSVLSFGQPVEPATKRPAASHRNASWQHHQQQQQQQQQHQQVTKTSNPYNANQNQTGRSPGSPTAFAYDRR